MTQEDRSEGRPPARSVVVVGQERSNLDVRIMLEEHHEDALSVMRQLGAVPG